MMKGLQTILFYWHESYILVKLALCLLVAVAVIVAGRWNKTRRLPAIWIILIALSVGMMSLMAYSIYLWATPPVYLGEPLMVVIYAFVELGYIDLLIWLLISIFEKKK